MEDRPILFGEGRITMKEVRAVEKPSVNPAAEGFALLRRDAIGTFPPWHAIYARQATGTNAPLAQMIKPTFAGREQKDLGAESMISDKISRGVEQTALANFVDDSASTTTSTRRGLSNFSFEDIYACLASPVHTQNSPLSQEVMQPGQVNLINWPAAKEVGDADSKDIPRQGHRAQKHPAACQCTLCPKWSTRAYNLRSHLRTHTDELPFVCSICGKAFARRAYCKRHEGLHKRSMNSTNEPIMTYRSHKASGTGVEKIPFSNSGARLYM